MQVAGRDILRIGLDRSSILSRCDSRLPVCKCRKERGRQRRRTDGTGSCHGVGRREVVVVVVQAAGSEGERRGLDLDIDRIECRRR